METKNVKFAEFTNSNSKLDSFSLCENVKNFVPTVASKEVHLLAFSGYFIVYSEV